LRKLWKRMAQKEDPIKKSDDLGNKRRVNAGEGKTKGDWTGEFSVGSVKIL